MWVLEPKEMESSSKIYLKDACRLGALVITKLSKTRCISLAARRRSFRVACKHD
jgi:hypothetical protein